MGSLPFSGGGTRPGPGRFFVDVLPARQLQRLQACLYLRAAVFQERRQRQSLAELVEGFVGGEAGAVGGDLEEDAVRLAEVEALEVEAVDLATVRYAHFAEPPSPGVVLLLVRGAEG